MLKSTNIFHVYDVLNAKLPHIESIEKKYSGARAYIDYIFVQWRHFMIAIDYN